jgi:hypothetical protein
MQTPNKKNSKGTSWKRRGGAIVAGLALTVTAGIGAGVAGSAHAASKSAPAPAPTMMSAGWGG